MSATGTDHDAEGIIPFFVYGTLMMSDGGEDRWIDDVIRVERNLIVCGYSLYITHGSFPYAMEVDSPDEYVFGELLWPRNDVAAGLMTKRLDQIEGHPSFYRRTLVDVTRNSRSTQQAWMYVYPIGNCWDPMQLVPIGASWRVWQSNHPHVRGAGAWRGSAYV